MTVRCVKSLCKDNAKEDVAEEVNKHVEQSTRHKSTVLFWATTCTSPPRTLPVALSVGQCCVLDEPFCAS